MISMPTAARGRKESAPRGLSRTEALEMMGARGREIRAVIGRAREARRAVFGDAVRLCSIVNAKSGRCPERCSFCSQSKHFGAAAPLYPLKPPSDILEAARRAELSRASEFSIVTSGRSVRSKREIASIEKAVALIGRETGLRRCASLGELHPGVYALLKEAGLQCYHHNVETAPSMHARIVPTHTFDDEARVVENARKAGLATCCGGILGMGETSAQRVELVFALRDIDPDFVPLNFLNPIKGTPLQDLDELTPMECLKIIAVFRLAMPDKHIVICGGRERNLAGLQGLMFDAGATGTMTGDYLTTKGQSPQEDWNMIRKAGYRIAGWEK
jgi:biotin synthase